MKKVKLCKLNDCRGDVSKRWYIDYGIYNQARKRLEIKRIWLPTNPPNADYRYQLAKDLSNEIDKKLKKGILHSTPKKEKKINPTNFLEITENILTMLVVEKVLRTKSKQTYYTACKHLDKFLLKTSIHFTDITTSIVQDFIRSLKVSDRHKKNIVGFLKSVCGYLIENNFMAYNPFLGSDDKIKFDDSELNCPFSDYEKKKIEDYLIANNKPLYLFTRFIFYSFIRPKELLHLQVKDVDLRTRTIKVKSDISKNKRSETVPIIKPLLSLIVENKVLENPSDYYIFGQGFKPSKTMQGGNTPTNQHREALKDLGLYVEKKTVLYSWKHTGNIFAYLSGLDIKIIQKMNRHRSLETTEIYLRKLGLFLDEKAYDASW
ncbi:tyrosine-type recombinase/integrase [Emticicia sp. 17c]|uniref:tyrosine-type recombinase/integrase n=1 Tax=Emticicia sp. 17c TaxID=3127704 RepID=UPI00301B759D